MPGFSSGNHEMSMLVGSSDRFLPVTGSRPLPDMIGEKITRPTEEIRPP